jgi:prepilin-type N-terminal cleavage/methylation domain-containing protein
MKKGFTLMELVIVIIILGILVTLGFRQYAVTIEKSRSAEARIGLGSVRNEAYEFYIRNNNTLMPPTGGNFDNPAAGIGNTVGMLPGPTPACQTSNYFSYNVVTNGANNLTATATRCTAGQGGKVPDGTAADTVTLTSFLDTGVDNWGGTGAYR